MGSGTHSWRLGLSVKHNGVEVMRPRSIRVGQMRLKAVEHADGKAMRLDSATH